MATSMITVSTYLPPKLKKALDKKCKKEKRSLSFYLRELINNDLKKTTKEK